MTMEQLAEGKVEHLEVFSHGKATHVVTSIVYGAQAFFVFDRKHSSSDTAHNVEGNLHAIIEKIPKITLNVKGELNMADEEKQKTENFTCTFIGDFWLPKNPSSFSDAVKLYQNLPKYLGTEGENAVPLKVNLYPLTLIDRKATKLIRDISINLINQTEKLFVDMYELNMKCKDIQESDTVKCFLAIKRQMEEFMNLTKITKLVIQKKFCELLPRIRGGTDEERCLFELLNKIHQSPISIPALHSWLDKQNKQVKVLNKYIRAMADITFAKEPGDLEAVVLGPENSYCLCLSIFVSSHDSELDQMKHYCLEKSFPENFEKSTHRDFTAQQTDSTPLMEVVGGFMDFHNNNKTKKGVAFIVTPDSSESDSLYARVECYKKGTRISKNYKLPSAPEDVKVLVKDTTHNSVTITWSLPKGNTSTLTSYAVSCYKDFIEHSSKTCDANENKVTISDLAANTEYEVLVWGRCEVGDGPVGDAKVTVKTKAASQPEMLQAEKLTSTKALLKWQPPACVANGCSVEQYIIKEEIPSGHWEEILRTASNECKVEIQPNTVPSFRVAASCGSYGLSCDSEPCTVDLIKPTTFENLKQNILTNSTRTNDNIHIFKPELKLIARNTKDEIEKYEFGEPSLCVQEKVIMLVGATGSGKTTLINGFVNYIFGVEWQDAFRFMMIMESNAADQAVSQTTNISSYTLHHREGFKVPYTLTIIDTPGFGDVSDIKRDQEITETIRKFFTTRSKSGIDHIDAVGFVANYSLPRLTPTQKYIFDQILSLFGKDIADNIFLLLTFADGKKPQVLSGSEKARIPYKKHFKFYNSALYVFRDDKEINPNDESDDDDGNFHKMVWDMGVKSFNKFLEQLKSVESKSLLLTQDVLNERNRLQTSIAGIQIEIRQGLSTLEKLKQEMQMLENHYAEIERNKNFEYEVEEEIFVKVAVPRGHYVTNCLKCNRTCHDDCVFADDADKIQCSAMTDGQCDICPEACIWSLHKNMPHMYKLTTKKSVKTVHDLRHKYEKAIKRKLTTEELIEHMKKEFEALQLKVIAMTNGVRMSIERLEEIALRPNPMTTVEYVDILIQAEKSQAEPGWQARLDQLQEVRNAAEYMEKVAHKGFDPFKQHLEDIESKMDESKNELLAKTIEYIKKKWYATKCSFMKKKTVEYQ